MIEIRNISDFRWSTTPNKGSVRGLPVPIEVGPKTKVDSRLVILQDDLKNYQIGTKMDLADGVSKGVLVLQELDSSHVTPDETPLPALSPYTANNLQGMIDAAIAFKNTYNVHEVNVAFHTAAGAAPITSADPTDLATLIVLLTEARTDYNTHIAAAIHPNPDTANGVILAAPVNAATCNAVLKELWGRYSQHKKWATTSANPPLNPPAIIAY